MLKVENESLKKQKSELKTQLKNFMNKLDE